METIVDMGETIVSVRDPLNYKGFFLFPFVGVKIVSIFELVRWARSQ